MPRLDMTRVTVATAIEDRSPYTDEAVTLFKSLDVFGGRVRAARRRACFIDEVSPESRRRLEELGVDVSVREALDPRFPFTNKIRMFDPADNQDTDLLVALDSDVIVAGDFAEYLDPTLVQAKQADGDALSLELWDRMFAHFGLTLPSERYPASLFPGWTHAYFNTGVLLVPGAHLADIYARWPHFVEAIVSARDTFAELAGHMEGNVPDYGGAVASDLRSLVFAEQWAFSLTLRELGAPYAVLPLAMNFPAPYSDDLEPGAYIRPRFLPDAIAPLLVHHHHCSPERLTRTGYEQPDRVLARVDAELRLTSSSLLRASPS